MLTIYYFYCNGCDQQQSKTKQDAFVKEDAWKATNTTSCCLLLMIWDVPTVWNPEFSRMQDLSSPRAWYLIFWDRSKWSSHEWNEIVSVWEQIPKCGCSRLRKHVQLNSPWPFEKTLTWTFEVQKNGGEQLRKDHWNHYEAAFSRDSCQVARRLQCFVYKRWNHGSLLDRQ